MKHPILIAPMSLLFAMFATTNVYASTNAQQEISTAILHASYAEKMTDVNKVHLHLHHVINCLVGTKGVGFDTKAGDPCLGMGNGAINDFNYKKADKLRRDMLKQALEDAQYGLMTDRLQIARNAADLAIKDLKKSQEDL
jgi:hypothetical protein